MNSEISKYTISVYELIDNNFDFQLNDYEIFDENYRSILNEAILNYYMFREIGFTNPTVWRHRLKTRLNIIMRNKYNALYKAKAKDFNPLYTMELYEDYEHSVKNEGSNNVVGEVTYNSNSTSNSNITSNTSSDTTNASLAYSSNFPSNEMLEDEIADSIYVDNSAKNKQSENSTDNTTETSDNTATNNDTTNQTSNISSNNVVTESYHKSTIGSASDLSFAHAMVQFKDYIDKFNLDQQVIDELKDLFMQVW